MQTLESQVRQLISGSAYGVTTEVPQNYIRDFLTRGVEYVIKFLPKELLLPFAAETSIPDAGLALKGLRLSGLINVRVGDNMCREVPADRKGKLIDSESLFYVRANTKNPVFYVFNGKVYVAPLASGAAYASHVNVDDVSSDVTTLLGELDDAIVNYAASMASKSLYSYRVEVDEDMELAGLHKVNAQELMQAATIAAQTYLSGKGISGQPQTQGAA